MNLIFLDFDGVLNSLRSVMAYNGIGKDGWDSPYLDPVAVLLLRRLTVEGNANIVLSTSWRKLYRIPFFFELFKKHYDWDIPIIGKTPSLMETSFRGAEVAQYLRDLERTETVDRYVILDDSTDFFVGDKKGSLKYEQDQPFVRINDLYGFSYGNYYSALKLLNPRHKHLINMEANLDFKNDPSNTYGQSPGNTGKSGDEEG